MERINVKLSTSRKPLYKLSVWQRRNVMLEVRRNLNYSFNRSNSNRGIRERNNSVQDIPVPSVAHPSEYSHNNFINDTGPNSTDVQGTLLRPQDVPETSPGHLGLSGDDGSLSSCSSSSCSSNDDDEVSLLFEDSSNELSFREQLASCFVDNNLTHVQGNNILSLLRTHLCFSNLPKDVRTLIGTPRRRVVVSNVEPGQYVHFDLARTLVQRFKNKVFLIFHLQVQLMNWN